MSDDSLLDLNLSDAAEPALIDPDKEVQFKVVKAEIKEIGSNNAKIISTILSPQGEYELCADIFHTVWLPKESDTLKQVQATLFRIRQFVEACGLDPAQRFSPSQLVGCQLWAIVGVDDDPKYGKRNTIKKVMAAR